MREAPAWDFRAKPACLTCFHPCFRPFVWLRALSLIQAVLDHFLNLQPCWYDRSLESYHFVFFTFFKSQDVSFFVGWISNTVNWRLVDPANTKNFQSQQNLETDVAVIINFSYYQLTDTVSVLSNLKLNHRPWNLKHWTLKCD